MDSEFENAFLWPISSKEIRESILSVFDSGNWGKYNGEYCELLTSKLAEKLGLPYFRLCSSGTVAVEIALAACGVRASDEVILAGYDFPGNFRAIESLSAIPVLADIQPERWTLDPDSVKNAISERTSAILVSHLHGGIADMESLSQIAQENGIQLIEDVCQCPGAKWKGKLLGTFGNACAFSFGGSKLLSAGRGGAVGTNDESILQRARIYCDRGNDAFPLSELQAAALIPQLNLLGEFAQQRRTAASKLLGRFNEGNGCSTVVLDSHAEPDFYKFPIRLADPSRRTGLVQELRAMGISIGEGFHGFMRRSERRCRKPVALDFSAAAAENTLLLHHPCLLSDQLDPIVTRILDAIRKA